MVAYAQLSHQVERPNRGPITLPECEYRSASNRRRFVGLSIRPIVGTENLEVNVLVRDILLEKS